MRAKTRLLGIIVLTVIVAVAWFTIHPTRLADVLQQNQSQTASQTVQATPDDLKWSEQKAPNYVAEAGSAKFSERTLAAAPGEITNLTDDLGRPSDAYANVTYQMMVEGSSRERDDLPNPVGWPKNAEVDIPLSDGSTYHGWLWNRSHLVAKSLGGPDVKDNLIAGTRTQNVGNNDGTGGMGLPETLAREWLANHQDGTILYEVHPNYLESDMIPRTVTVDMRTSDGAINTRYMVYNAAKGFVIDYTNSTWWETR